MLIYLRNCWFCYYSSWPNWFFSLLTFNSLHFLAISIHRRTESTHENWGWAEVHLRAIQVHQNSPFSCSFIYPLNKYLLITYYRSGTARDDEDLIVSKTKYLHKRVNALEVETGVQTKKKYSEWDRNVLLCSRDRKSVWLGLGAGYQRGWYEMKLQRKAGVKSFKPCGPSKELRFHSKNIGK